MSGDVHQSEAGIIKGKDQKPIIVNGVRDHVHVFVGLKHAINISDLIRDIKNNSSNFINEHRFVMGRFSWQEGYGVFSYGAEQISTIYNYINLQEEHHRKKTFKEEYLDFLKAYEIVYDEKYLFDWNE